MRPTLIEAARVIQDLLKNSTFSAWAGESCRQCPRAFDGGCTGPHDADCPYQMSVTAAQEFVKRVTGE